MSAIEAPSEWPTSRGRRHAQLIEQGGQDVQRLLVHEPDRTRAREPVGAAVAEAGVDQRRRAEPGCDLVREVAPQLRRAQALVQEHQGVPGGVAGDRAELDGAAGDGGEWHWRQVATWDLLRRRV